jgi:hypothetical protein
MRLFVFLKLRNRLAAGEAGLDFVPEADGVFAELPAEADVVAAVTAEEIDEAHLIVLQVAADVVELLDVILEVLNGDVDARLNRRLVFVLGRFEVRLERRDLLVGFDNVGNDAAHQRQGTVCLGELESLGDPGRSNGFWSSESRTSHRKRPPFYWAIRIRLKQSGRRRPSRVGGSRERIANLQGDALFKGSTSTAIMIDAPPLSTCQTIGISNSVQ